MGFRIGERVWFGESEAIVLDTGTVPYGDELGGMTREYRLRFRHDGSPWIATEDELSRYRPVPGF